MLGAGLVERLTEAGLFDDGPALADLLDLEPERDRGEQLTIEDIAAYIGPDSAMGTAMQQWERDKRALMRPSHKSGRRARGDVTM